MSAKRRPAVYVSHATRRRREFWLRLGVWIFIFIFALSLVGGLFIFAR